MALSRSTRVNILIGNGHFLSHFYVLCLPPMFVVWQNAFNVSFAELGLTIALMSGTTAILQTPVGFLVDRHGARPFLIRSWRAKPRPWAPLPCPGGIC